VVAPGGRRSTTCHMHPKPARTPRAGGIVASVPLYALAAAAGEPAGSRFPDVAAGVRRDVGGFGEVDLDDHPILDLERAGDGAIGPDPPARGDQLDRHMDPIPVAAHDRRRQRASTTREDQIAFEPEGPVALFESP